jgi:formylglycine-generating enzyme required for sulfatase activity
MKGAVLAAFVVVGCGSRVVSSGLDAPPDRLSPSADAARADTADTTPAIPDTRVDDAAMGVDGPVQSDSGAPGDSGLDATDAVVAWDTSSADVAAEDTASPSDVSLADSAAPDAPPPDVPPLDVPPPDVPPSVARVRPRRSCPDGLEHGCGVARVRGGTFDMGPGDVATLIQRGITVSPFVMDRYEVTVRRFRRFFDARMPRPPAVLQYPGGEVPMRGNLEEPVANPMMIDSPYPQTWTRRPVDAEDKPINALTWATAQAFCVWDGGRLPTEAEWEWVGFHLPDGRPVPRTYPFGDAPYTCEHAYLSPCRRFGTTGPMPVGSRLAEGLFYDFAGNLMEFTADASVSFADEVCWGGIARVNPVCGERPGVLLRSTSSRGSSYIVDTPSTVRTRSPAQVLYEWGFERSTIIGMRCVYPP